MGLETASFSRTQLPEDSQYYQKGDDLSIEFRGERVQAQVTNRYVDQRGVLVYEFGIKDRQYELRLIYNHDDTHENLEPRKILGTEEPYVFFNSKDRFFSGMERLICEPLNVSFLQETSGHPMVYYEKLKGKKIRDSSGK